MAKSQSGNNTTKDSYEFKTELQGLIRLLAKNLYADSDVFVREMIQNAHDAVNRRKQSQKENSPEGVVRIRINHSKKSITFSDNGAGLTKEEIHEYLSTIGKSGTDEFRKSLLQQGRLAEVNLVGQFGIGLLSAFIVAKRVTVDTFSFKGNEQAWQWESYGDKDYTIEEGERSEAGSTVTLYISEDHKDVLDDEFIRNAIRKYADFLPVSIIINDEEGPTNSVNAPWHKIIHNEGDFIQDLGSYIVKRFPSEYPLEIIPVKIHEPYHVEGVLFISDRHVPYINTSGQVDIYQSRMFIASKNTDILPPWATFLRGVIDSTDFTPTAARDAVQRDGVFMSIRDALGKIVIERLKYLAKENPERFQRLMHWHQYHIKGMALSEPTFFNDIADMVPFSTNKGVMSLQAYLERSAIINRESKFRNIFYFTEEGSATQFYLLCDSKGLIVINASYIFEENFLKKYAEKHQDVRLHQIDMAGAEFIFEPLSDGEKVKFSTIETTFEAIGGRELNVKAKVVHFSPETLPAVTTLAPEAKLLLELRQTRENWRVPENVRDVVDKVIGERPLPLMLYLNASNQIIQQIVTMDQFLPATANALLAIYNNALLLSQQRIHPRDAEMMVRQSNDLIGMFISGITELEQTRSQLSAMRIALQEQREQKQETVLTSHVRCFVALPFSKDYDILFETIQALFETKPFYWEIARADERYLKDEIRGNIQQLMSQSHCYMAEISDTNPNVMIELGMMRMHMDRPTFLLRKKEVTADVPANLKGVIYLAYPSKVKSSEELLSVLRDEFSKADVIKHIKGSAKYLSPYILRVPGIDHTAIDAITSSYTTVEEFMSLPVDEIAKKTGVLTYLIQALKDHLNDYCKII
jgi:molecular chaperone HtpG